MKRYTFSKFVLSVLVLGLTVVAPGMSWASRLIDNNVSNSNTINNSSQIFNGTYVIDGHGADDRVDPFTVQVFARQGECVRIEGITINGFPTITDTEMVLIAPNGIVWRDDDGGVGFLSLLKIAPAPATGWYTLQIHRFGGFTPGGDVSFRYGRYNGSNANCAGATDPLVQNPNAFSTRSEK